MEVSLAAAFLGGALALLSPCGALLLPAFFAATVGSRLRLLLHGGLFFLGLCLTLVPLGLGASLVGSLLTTHRELVITGAGWLIIVFGAAQVLGLGFDVSRLLPGARSVQSTAPRNGAAARSLLLGTVSGVAGFCSGPILGAVLTMAATEPSQLLAGVMLAVYGAGMVVPLVLIAALWSRLGTAGRARLRGRAWQVGSVQLHSTSVVTGLLLVVVGVVFLRTNGMASLPQLVPAQLLGRLQSAVLSVGAAVPEPLLIVVSALAALGAWAWWRRRSDVGPLAGDDGPTGADLFQRSGLATFDLDGGRAPSVGTGGEERP
ncbi:cytochrome c biogenesis CcdA family protein [Georgenia satyanarayanai]|uniref:cytochrome c biogenesis CcdA family protein n=1 Tax=Georgenia satyanarayanai TaxID=860221 RepID=UPI0020417E90|nr:cytochrome c biogenesis CcdA family protein [Georgenia satyanarayanai]MCM3661371.1 cytochrome c biogenesis CcdA family protein [Georgenia satyanarayanai]